MDLDLESLLAELVSGDDERAEAAALKMASFGENALPGVRALLDSPNMDERWWAIRALAQMETPPLDWLLRSLEDEAEEVRQCAILALAHHPGEQAIPVLVRFLYDPEPVTVNLAASALVSIGAPAVPALIDLPVDAPHLARVEAVRALALIADPRAVPTLMAGLEKDSPAMHYWAEQGLERLGVGLLYFKPD